MSESERNVVIIGAGVVGLSTAIYLARTGRNVTVLDPLPPPGGASYGNAGMISAETSVPVALPGMIKKVPGWLLDPVGPLSVKPSYFPTALPWLMRWIAAGRSARLEAISDAMRALHRESFARWRELLDSNLFSELVRETGQVHLWEGEKETPTAALERHFRERHGVLAQDVTKDLPHLFPGISPRYKRAILVPGNGYTISPQKLIQALYTQLLEVGGEVLFEQVRGIMPRENGFGVFTNVTVREAGQLVVAAGAWSGRLIAPLGIKVPLETERGYHIMLPNAGIVARTTLSNKSGSFGVTPMEGGLRVAGTVEFAGLDAPPDERRADALLANIRGMFPGIDVSGHVPWMGHRPSTPDSLPILGEARSMRDLFLAFGHGHFGMTGGPPSADLISSLMNRRETRIPPKPYSPDRFNN